MRCQCFGLLLFLIILAAPATGQTDRHLLYVIYDSSNSMWGELSDGSRKYEAGRKAIASALVVEPGDRDLAFRAYGHRRASDCRDSELIVSPISAEKAKPKISTAVNEIRPTGKTPISYSLRESLKDFGDRKGDILLISDGIETCDMDPCSLMSEWRNQGVKIRVHVVGIGLNEVERNAMMCVAEAGGGVYFDAGSEGELQDALSQASTIEPGEPSPVEQVRGYALRLQGTDETGRSFLLNGHLFKDGEQVGTLTSNGRNALDGPGDYEIEVGPLLRDGSIYKPVRQAVSINNSGDTWVNVTVTRPAIVSASFSENGDEARGAGVSAWQDGREVFRFRRFDEVLARPGDYDFRAKPNDDNELEVSESLLEGEHTVVNFVLVNTVGVRFRYVLPNGEDDQRTGQLYQDDVLRYSTSGRRFTTVLPGNYELRDKYADPLNPLTVTAVTISTEEEQVIDIPMSVGYIATAYGGAARDFHTATTTYTYIHAVDPETGKSSGSVTSAPDRIEVAKPGLYRVIGHSGKGYFDPVEVQVEHDKTVTAALIAKPTAHISVTYAEADYERIPDRAFLRPLEGQTPNKTYMRPGAVLRVPPGRYRIDPHMTPGVEPVEINLGAGDTKTLVLE